MYLAFLIYYVFVYFHKGQAWIMSAECILICNTDEPDVRWLELKIKFKK